MTRMRSVATLAAILAGALAWAGAHGGAEPSGPATVTAVVLGVAQDGGLPHLGCVRPCCEAARRDPSRAQRVASLGLVVEAPPGPPALYLLDATPDLRSQVDTLASIAKSPRPPGLPVDGIFLTHAHVGHYTGLMYLGKESMAARGVPVHATPRMIEFLKGSAPWRRLLEWGHIDARPLEMDRAVTLAAGVTVTPLRVPHRDEDSDTVGFVVAGPSRRLLYVPDTDAWEAWDRDVASLVGGVDVALLDGSFHGSAEIPGRAMADIPHPMIPATMQRLERVREGRRILFIHLNHSNPALSVGSDERRAVEARGFEVATDGMRLPL
ncbi:MAG: MBL fold metallo-hydrolase [Candidatus Polarisedimenticolia bacterium]